MGQLLRTAAKEDSPAGRELHQVINVAGRLASFDLAMGTFRRALEAVPASQSVIFDGTPRRHEEVVYWDSELPKLGRSLTHIIALQLSEDGTVERLSKRRVCERDGRPFILGVDLKSEDSPCPDCGGRILQRADDQPEAIRTRLATYRKMTEPVLDEYRPRGIVHEVNGDQPIEEVYRAIEAALAL
jgi:adenylate kinase